MSLSKYQSICNGLEENQQNVIKDVKKALKNEINGDRNEFLRIKAECNEDDYNNAISQNMSAMAVILAMVTNAISIMSVIFDTESNKMFQLFYLVLMGLTIIISVMFVVYLSVNMKKKGKNKYWRKYISVILDDMDKNWNKYFK
jgi:hypothetical protein